MNDLYEILRQKEMAIERVRKEIAALKFVVPLLGDDGEPRRTSESPSSWRKDSGRVKFQTSRPWSTSVAN